MGSQLILFVTTWFCLWVLGVLLHGAYLCVEDAEMRWKDRHVDKNKLNK